MPNESTEDELKVRLFSHLRNGNEDLFVEQFSKIPPEDVKTYANSVMVDDTILQVACYLNCKKAVEVLLQNGANPSLITQKNKKSPLEITITRGYYRVFHVLINCDLVNIKSNEILIEILHRVSKVKEPQRRYFKACLDVYLNSKKRPDLNLPSNDKGVTPLEYAVKYCTQDLVLELLKHGASLAIRSPNNPNLLVEIVDGNTLKKHLDQCLEVDLHYLKCNDDKENLKICYNYKSLIPPQIHLKNNNVEEEDKDNGIKLEENSSLVDKLSTSISKIQEVIKIEDENLLINENSVEVQAEIETIWCICNNPELRHLITHPVITSFIFMKWRQVSWFYNINRLRLITMFILFLLQALNFHTFYGRLPLILIFVRCALIFLFLIQMGFVVSGGLLGTSVLYFSLNDLPELTCYILIIILPPVYGRSLCAFVVFFLSFRLLFTLGEHTTHVQMFKVVTYNFFGVLITYTILVFGYAISLYTLLIDNTNTTTVISNNNNQTITNITTATNSSNVEQSNFPSLTFFAMSLFKSFLVLTGEFWSISLPLIPIVSDILFMMFVLIVTINLLNFLSGLAVSDVQQIRQEAKLSGLKSKIKLIASLECDLIGNETQMKGKTLLGNIDFLIKKNIQKLIECRHGKESFAREICLFPYILTNYKLEVYPNQQGRIKIPKDNLKRIRTDWLSSLPIVSLFFKNNKLKLDQQTTSQTLLLMKEKKEVLTRGSEEEARFKYLEESIEIIKNGQKNLNKKLDSILQKIETISSSSR